MSRENQGSMRPQARRPWIWRVLAIVLAFVLIGAGALVFAASSTSLFSVAGEYAPPGSLVAPASSTETESLTVTLPAQFSDTSVADVPQPTALAFTPDGRLLVTTRRGEVLVYHNGTLLTIPALDLRRFVCNNGERGLLGIAVDPDFASNHHFYLYYTFKKFGSCEVKTQQLPVNRVARFTLADSNVVDPKSEMILVDNILSPGRHNGGDLHFGKDGYLYISVGDGACDYADDSGCWGGNDAAQDMRTLLGKILRITSTGEIPPTNPFQGPDSVRCHTSGMTETGKTCSEIFAYGLRNPFRMGFDPNASQTRFFINDVGQGEWEEVDEGVAGANYGWNDREGHCSKGSRTECPPPPTSITDPIYDYNHDTECTVISDGAFVPNGTWPASYDGAYLFSDFRCGTIFQLVPDAKGDNTAVPFVKGLKGPVSLVFGPAGDTQALYYTLFTGTTGTGEVRRITYEGAR